MRCHRWAEKKRTWMTNPNRQIQTDLTSFCYVTFVQPRASFCQANRPTKLLSLPSALKHLDHLACSRSLCSMSSRSCRLEVKTLRDNIRPVSLQRLATKISFTRADGLTMVETKRNLVWNQWCVFFIYMYFNWMNRQFIYGCYPRSRRYLPRISEKNTQGQQFRRFNRTFDIL